MQVEPVAMLVRSVARGLPAWLVISAKAPPPSASSPAGSLTLQVEGRSKASWPSAVVYVFHAADGALVSVASGVPAAVSVAGAVAVAVSVAGGEMAESLGLADVGAGGPACGPHPVSSKTKRHAAEMTTPDEADLRISPSLGGWVEFFNCDAAGCAGTSCPIDCR